MFKEPTGVMLYYENIRPACKMLKDEQNGRLLMAILDYAEHGLYPEFQDKTLELVWAFVQPRIDADKERYYEKCEQASLRAKKRWNADVCAGI